MNLLILFINNCAYNIGGLNKLETSTKIMQIENNQAIISKYEVLAAFFRTEENDDIDMASKLNELINQFYVQERHTKRNVTELTFEITNSNENVISFIKAVNQ